MIKKMVSNALLSMVMDKKAREKFTAVQDQKRQKKPREQNKAQSPSDTVGNAPRPTSQSAAQMKASAGSMRPPDPISGAVDDPEALIREALEEAELELIQKRKKKPMTSERQALIEQAMAIHKSKSHVLDDLDPEHREKLTFMAMKALDKNFGE